MDERGNAWIKRSQSLKRNPATPNYVELPPISARREGCSEVVRQLPEVDILVNNVGIFEPKPFEKISDAGMGEILRRQCPLRGAVEPSLPGRDERTQLGPDRFHLE